MRTLLTLVFVSFTAVAANADSTKSDHVTEHAQTYTARVDKLEAALRSRSHHALATLPQGMLDQLKSGQSFTLAKTDEHASDESSLSYAIVIGDEREEISAAAYDALREVSQAQR
jgi:hypothetical protein